MLLALSDKVLYIVRHVLGSQINSEIHFDSIFRNLPAFGGFVEGIIYAVTGYPRNLSKIIVQYRWIVPGILGRFA
jgi:hypothetical protein